ncbi:hypothetical protein ACFFWC_21715 [Plantactinospora siamensis]|uniref:Uncharacterized protein n=1 Tax=Plantactinospora siamensis TaxID=555372 RepID=A0ABV6P6X7_9ACTN
MESMHDLTDAVKRLAEHTPHGPALIVRTPDGQHLVSPDGSGESPRNQYVISRSQLGSLMWEHGYRREHLTDPQQAAELAALVAAFRPPHGHPSTKQREQALPPECN